MLGARAFGLFGDDEMGRIVSDYIEDFAFRNLS
jgi:hypothetical protein